MGTSVSRQVRVTFIPFSHSLFDVAVMHEILCVRCCQNPVQIEFGELQRQRNSLFTVPTNFLRDELSVVVSDGIKNSSVVHAQFEVPKLGE